MTKGQSRSVQRAASMIKYFSITHSIRSTGKIKSARRAASVWLDETQQFAALLANKIDADQLVLLKSCEAPKNIDLREAARREIIDPIFATIVRSAQVEIVKLP